MRIWIISCFMIILAFTSVAKAEVRGPVSDEDLNKMKLAATLTTPDVDHTTSAVVAIGAAATIFAGAYAWRRSKRPSSVPA